MLGTSTRYLIPGLGLPTATVGAPGPGMLSPSGPGAPAVAVVAGPFPGTAPSAARWSLVDIDAQDRPLAGLGGAPLVMPTAAGGVAGALAGAAGIARRWLDAELASACVAAARGQLDAARANRDAGGLGAALASILDAYSCLNLPWSSDPSARFLWQTYVAGPPDSVASEFSPAQPFNACCSLDQPYRAGLGVGPWAYRVLRCTRYGGLIPGAGRAMFDRYMSDPAHAADHGGEFDGYYWPGLGLAVGGSTPAATGPRSGQLAYMPSADTDRVLAGAESLQNRGVYFGPGVFGPGMLGAFSHGVAADGTRFDAGAPGAAQRWDGYLFDSEWTVLTTHQTERFASAPSDYVAWLDHWLTALESRTPHQVVLDAAAYVVYRNQNTVNLAGGSLDAAVRAVVGVGAQEWTPATNVQNDLRVVAAISGAAGAALAGPTLGISALVGGVVAAVASIGSTLVGGDLSMLHANDVLQPKPQLDRMWLAGSPANVSITGAPLDVVVAAPAGWTRPVAPRRVVVGGLLAHASDAALAALAASPPLVPAVLPAPRPPWTPAEKTVAAGVGLAAGALALARLLGL